MENFEQEFNRLREAVDTQADLMQQMGGTIRALQSVAYAVAVIAEADPALRKIISAELEKDHAHVLPAMQSQAYVDAFQAMRDDLFRLMKLDG